MLFVAVMGAVLLYIIVLITVPCLVRRYGRRWGMSKTASSLLGLLAFLLLFVPVFWDWIPSYRAYQHYCATEAGVTQYKTLAQWRAENPGAYETLRIFSDEENEERWALEEQRYIERDGGKVRVLGGIASPRFGNYSYDTRLPLSITKWTTEFIDEQTGETLVKRVRFKAGPGNVLELGGPGYKIWLNQPMCGDENHDYFKIVDAFVKREP